VTRVQSVGLDWTRPNEWQDTPLCTACDQLLAMTIEAGRQIGSLRDLGRHACRADAAPLLPMAERLCSGRTRAARAPDRAATEALRHLVGPDDRADEVPGVLSVANKLHQWSEALVLRVSHGPVARCVRSRALLPWR
jgi:hypothetical protein